MDFNKLFPNLAISTIWGLILFLIAHQQGLDRERSAVAGLLGFTLILLTLWLIVDTELDETWNELLKAILIAAGLGFLSLIGCLTLLRILQSG